MSIRHCFAMAVRSTRTVLGLIILQEEIGDRALVAVILVTLASLGASFFEKRRSLE